MAKPLGSGGLAAPHAMRVAIDLTPLLPAASGVDRYMLSMVASLLRLDSDHRYIVFVNAEDRQRIQDLLPGRERGDPRCRLIPAARRSRPVRLLWQQAALPVAVRTMSIDVVHSPSFLMPIVRAGAGHLLTVHDMTSFLLPQHHPWYRRGRAYESAVRRSIRQADLVSVPSQATRQDVLRAVPDKDPADVRVIPCGIDDAFNPPSRAELAAVLARLGLAWPYVLFVGTLDPRKNLARLIEAYVQAVEHGAPEHLVIAGQPGWQAGNLLQRVPLALRERVHVLGYVPDPDLPHLYAGATVFVYPSLMEGFGFPPLEAMACGTPVIASNLSALRENLEGAACLVEPTEISSIAASLERLLGDAGLRQQHRNAGLERATRFRWDSFARATAACYEEAARRRKRTSPIPAAQT